MEPILLHSDGFADNSEAKDYFSKGDIYRNKYEYVRDDESLWGD